MTYAIPTSSLLAKTSCEYVDCFAIPVKGDPPILEVAKALFLSVPDWVRQMMNLRNYLVHRLGLKTATEPPNAEQVIQRFDGEVGSAIGLFKVYDRSENEIVFGQDDRHLNFRASLLLENGETEKLLHFTTIVNFHNRFGRVYFVIVKPFHKIIVKRMLRSTKAYIERT